MRKSTIACVAAMAALGFSSTAVAEDYTLASHVKLSWPRSLECNDINTIHWYTDGEASGLSFIGLDIDNGNIEGVKNGPSIKLYYNNKLMKSLNPGLDEEVSIIGAGMFADDDLPSFEAQNTIFMVMAYPGTKDFDNYRQPGVYKLEIPDGAFSLGGTPLKGMTLNYTYSTSNQEFVPDMTYTLEPSAGSEITDKAKFLADGIIVTFPNLIIGLDYKGNGGGSLTSPSGEVISMSYPTKEGNGLRFKAGENTVLAEDGAYVFKIEPNRLAVDQPAYEDGGNVAPNFPGLEATYIVSNGTTGVALIGIGAADSYDVYSLDGKALLKNADAAALAGLAEGLYVINGKKVLLKK